MVSVHADSPGLAERHFQEAAPQFFYCLSLQLVTIVSIYPHPPSVAERHIEEVAPQFSYYLSPQLVTMESTSDFSKELSGYHRPK